MSQLLIRKYLNDLSDLRRVSMETLRVIIEMTGNVR
jgi:hypothetical protein